MDRPTDDISAPTPHDITRFFLDTMAWTEAPVKEELKIDITLIFCWWTSSKKTRTENSIRTATFTTIKQNKHIMVHLDVIATDFSSLSLPCLSAESWCCCCCCSNPAALPLVWQRRRREGHGNLGSAPEVESPYSSSRSRRQGNKCSKCLNSGTTGPFIGTNTSGTADWYIQHVLAVFFLVSLSFYHALNRWTLMICLTWLINI